MATITTRQRDVLRFVQAHVKRHDCAPTRAEIGRALDISRPTAEQHLQALRRAGLVTLRTQWRGIFLTQRPMPSSGMGSRPGASVSGRLSR